MPELPEVETVRRGLRGRLIGARLAAALVRDPRLRRRVDRRALTRLLGRPIVDIGRRAKYLLIDIEGGDTLVIHLGMSGSLLLVEPRTPHHAHDHVCWTIEPADSAGSSQLRFRDPRRFGLVVAARTAALSRHPLLRHLGAEPFDPDLTPAMLRRRAHGSRRPIKNFLLDARVIAGIGNIYASEALWRAGIHPTRASGRIALARWTRLLAAARGVLEEAIEQGGTTLENYRRPEGTPGYFAVRLDAYGREGQPCNRCHAAIRRRVIGGRSTFYCPRCQR